MPVVVLTGARQTGKSTLARGSDAGSGRLYLSLDDLGIREDAGRRPADLVERARRMTLDEVQRVPDLLLAVKQSVDEDREAGRYLLTGSADLLLLRQAAESLAGRAYYLTLHPLTRRERAGLGEAGSWPLFFEHPPGRWRDAVEAIPARPFDWVEACRVGGFPTPALELTTEEERRFWFAGYVATWLERDLRDLAMVSELGAFQRLMRAAAARLGTLLNTSALGRELGLPRTTVDRWLGLLETAYVLVRLPPYSVNRRKRLVRAPRIYWADTGLALHLVAPEAPGGAHLENLVLGDLLAWRGSLVSPPEILHWRTHDGFEVDFVIEWGDRLLPIEVKSGGRPGTRDARGLEAFLAEYGDLAVGGLLLHGGPETHRLGDRILAAPLERVL